MTITEKNGMTYIRVGAAYYALAEVGNTGLSLRLVDTPMGTPPLIIEAKVGNEIHVFPKGYD